VKTVFDIRQILELLPHRYPFLMVDRIVEIEPRQRIVGIKCVSINEPYFQGHFPGVPVMPGVLIIEALAQAAATLVLHEVPERAARLVYFTGIDEARFRRPVGPGDVLRLEVDVLQLRPRAAKMKAVAKVGNGGRRHDRVDPGNRSPRRGAPRSPAGRARYGRPLRHDRPRGRDRR
jgi:3-hydroxyacyl-[acyl-carrier-protein] dehydratase